MHFSSTYAFILALRLLATIAFFSPLAEFWAAVVELLDVPEPIKLFFNPLLGALCYLIVEFRIEYQKKKKNPAYVISDEPAWLFPGKIFVGWVVGNVGLEYFAMFIKGSNTFVAFLGGAAGALALSMMVSRTLNKMDNDDSTKNDNNPPTP